MSRLWLIGAALLALCLTACSTSPLTVAPRPVVAAVASWDGNIQNSGLVAPAPGGGIVVTAHFVQRFNAMAKSQNGVDILPPAAPDRWPGCFVVTKQEMARFFEMNRRRKAGLSSS